MLRSRHSGRSLLFALRSLLPAPFVAVRYEYSPYGELLEADVSPHLSAPCSLLHAPCFFGFQSKLRDPETGFWYFGHRFFDSRCAQWLTHDPLREEGGGFNLTCFCGGDPVNAVDPWGLFSNDDMLVEYVEKFGAEGLGLLNLLVGEFKDTGLAFAQHDFYAWQGKCQIGGGVVVLESDFTASQAAESLHNALRKRYGRFAGVLLQGATVGVCGVIRQSDNEVFREVMDELHWDDTAFDWNFTMARAGEVASFIQAGVETEVKWSVGAWIGAKSIELALEGVKTWRQARRLKAAAAAVANVGDAAESGAVRVYRGVNNGHADFARQSQGIVDPNRKWWQFWRQKSTPYQHNAIPGGTLDSPYTSWTTDPRVAENYALRPGSTAGVVIEAEVPALSIVTSPNTKSVLLIQGGGVVSESEVLLRGTVRGVARRVGPRW